MLDKKEITYNLITKVKEGDIVMLAEIEKCLLPLAMKVASSMIKTYKIEQDTSEAGDYILVFHETVVKTASTYNPLFGEYYPYFITSYVTNLYSYFEMEYRSNVLLFNSVSLDAIMSKGDRTLHEMISSNPEDDPRCSYAYSEAHDLIFSDAIIEKEEQERLNHRNSSKFRLQKQLILLKFYGYTINELAKMYGVNVSMIRRIMNDDGELMPLTQLKKIFNKN